MTPFRLTLLAGSVLLASCTSLSDKGTLAELRGVKPELVDERIEGGIEKAMAGYQKFLQETPDSAMTPEAIRRLADLKLEKEYGVLENAGRGPGATAANGGATVSGNATGVPSALSTSNPTATAAASSAAASAIPALTTPTTATATALASAASTAGTNASVTAGSTATAAAPAAALASPLVPAKIAARPLLAAAGKKSSDRESAKAFEKRAAADTVATSTAPDALPEEGADLHNAGALEALALYQQLLDKYPHYERNDQVLYQMSRAYEELGRVEDAMGVMNRIVREYPRSRYLDEINFRRGEFYFTRKKFLDAEGAYKAIVATGEGSFYYELARYKLGWAFYKQEMQEEALHQFVALLDYKQRQGFELESAKDDFEKQRVEDTYRVISLSFSALGGADAVMAYFDRNGHRSYEVNIYRNLGEHYLEKRRYADAAASYKAFVSRNPFHKIAPHFDMRVIEIYKQGGFPQLVIDANKEFATRYGLKSAYWTHFAVADYPDVLGYLKTNLRELANYYHALYQEKTLEKDKPANFAEASHWYHEFLDSFPQDAESPVMNYQLADLLLENRAFGDAAREYERTAYDYPAHGKAAAAGYAAVYAHREHLAVAAKAGPEAQNGVKREVIRSSLRFADTFPQHEKAALVMGAALDDIYALKDYPFAVATGRKLLAAFPTAEPGLRRGAWLVVAHSSFELVQYRDAEEGYTLVLQLTAADDAARVGLTENLAAAIYKQGEQANVAAAFEAAAGHFLRVGQAAPESKIRPAADYDAATAFIQVKAWDRAAVVLLDFRKRHTGHALQSEVTKKIAHIYHEAGQLTLAAAEYERIETETKDESLRREALQFAAELYLKANAQDNALQVYRRFLGYFPKPLEAALETRQRIAILLRARNEQDAYLKELRQIVDADAKGGSERTERTRYLGATSALVLTEPLYTQFAEIRLTQPFDKSLKKKKAAMKSVNDAFGKLVAYEVGDVTAAATFYIAEAYANFSESLKTSERPGDLDELESEQYEEALDEQSYPFEEKAIQIHEKNLKLIGIGVYNAWIDKSLGRLAAMMPGRYARQEESSGYIGTLVNVSYVALVQPAPQVPEPEPAAAAPGPVVMEAEVPAEYVPVSAPVNEPALTGG